ncbi:High-affinity nicotinic acid transporter [Conoideocrella luteorostrata]|uniref:High-affinity nicotinic acid transporter n=1 Tax=Conoideocrella luteorostrata TaxID=1105319 RepID=A0AAJ0CK70_9HYPO|nr:High-affinity nicotinic acid transporter [Conoideocrella luteorostrata]
MAVGADEKGSGSLRQPQGAVAESHAYPEEPHQKLHNGSSDEEEDVTCPSHTTEKRLMMKIDLHVIPFLCVMYLLAFLDRVNIANAKIYNLVQDLHMQPSQFNTAIVIFFVPYVLFEIPSNVFLKRFKPSTWLSLNMFLFGFTTIMQGLVQNYSGLLATRFFLGVFETGMFPGAFYLIGMWYRRHEAQRRYSLFFNSTSLAGAFGGLLAAAIGKMGGLRGYNGWRWIFIIEGGLTVFVSFFFYFWLPNFPEQAQWLKDDERNYVAARLRLDQGKSGLERKITLRDIGNVFKDYKVIVGGFMYLGLIVPAYGYAYFAPSIISSYGYSPTQTQLRSVPPWAAAFGFSMVVAYISDKLKHRMFFAIIPILIGIAGFSALRAVHNNTDVQYGCLFMAAAGAYTAMPVIVCWFNMNLGGHHRRAVGSAWQVGFGNLGGIIAAFAYDQDKSVQTSYNQGYTVSIVFCIVSVLSCLIYGFGCWKANRDRNNGKSNVGHLSEEEKLALGDMNPTYRYLL